ncbi:MAG: phenylalanine--tRNA ligase subunit beta [Verrucomicrobia bacterium]|nr:phenylalanine--tRNA ligase subunit beta [Verrucomicrobiota bacterium]MDE3098071.1 phenylalanine--tRNA ligase subunit beta [Verrucomicrobiota bacterium]
MKITFSRLKRYVDFDWPPDELAERLTMLGIEVENVRKVAGEFEGIVVAQILSRDAVPGSDKLSVCRVADGKMERTIICGAQNHKPGDKVALILPNFALPMKPGDKEPFVIKERKVFGITSQGMMCSPQELGLADAVDGLLILRADAKIGQSFAEYLGRAGGDVVYDLEITPNRPDLNSWAGIAREIGALTGNAVKLPEPACPESAGRVADLVGVRIEDTGLCGRYTARVVRGVKIGPSPDWLREALEKAGVRSINNVVDVTNYVMLETGQPLHAFDYHLISGEGKPTIIVRRAKEGEAFVTLDGQKRALTGDMLVIADESKSIALAGVMGGQNTEIGNETRDVLIESAYFSPTNIRRTSKALELRSESSYRFERGADIGVCDHASRRAAQLILETAGGQLAGGVVDEYPAPARPAEIALHFQRTTALLGIPISHAEQITHLTRLGLTVTEQSPGVCSFQVPTFRVDLKREVDLIEEVGRLHGAEKIPATPPRGAVGANPYDAVHDQISAARHILAALGLNEAQGQTLLAAAECRGVENGIVLANPLSSDMDTLRPSLLPGLIHSLRHNVSRKSDDIALFEIGRVFLKANGGGSREERRVALALTGRRAPGFWSGTERDAKFDIHDLKGLVEDFFEQFGIRGAALVRREAATALFIESAGIALGGKLPLGEMGQLSPLLARKYDLRDPVFLAELNLDQLLARRNPSKSFRPLPSFPSSRRDVAMLVPESATHDAVLQTVKQARPPHLESVELFDVFRGKNVPAGQKSVAYAFTYRSAERTLTDAEVSAAHAKVVEALRRQLSASVRE